MSRTLHIIDQAGAVAPAAVLRLSLDAARYESQDKNEQHAWLFFGGEAMRDTARAVGLRDDQYQLMPKPVGVHKLLPQALNKPRQLMQQAHRVVCWTEGAAQITSLLGCAHVVRRVSDATRGPVAERLIQQAHQGGSTPPIDREALRQQWGVEQNTLVIALLGDRLEELDASAAVMTMALTYEALRAAQPEHTDVRLLCHPLAKRRDEASVFSELLHFEHLMIQDERVLMPWSVLPACDVALAPVPDEAGLSILWAQAFGVPIVMPGESESTISARSSKPSDLADALTHWARSRSTSPASV